MISCEVRTRVRAVEVQGLQRDCEIAELSGRVLRILAATLEATDIDVSLATSAHTRRLPFARRRPLPRGKSFTLLWRGNSDGFGSRGFHGHANILTLILDMGASRRWRRSESEEFSSGFEESPKLSVRNTLLSILHAVHTYMLYFDDRITEVVEIRN